MSVRELCPDVYGQAAAREALARALASGRVAHAYLLAGPEGVGKRRFAEGFSRALLCGTASIGSGDASEVG